MTTSTTDTPVGELKRCPWCPAIPTALGHYFEIVHTADCYFSVMMCPKGSAVIPRRQVIINFEFEAWNTRTPEPVLVEGVERLGQLLHEAEFLLARNAPNCEQWKQDLGDCGKCDACRVDRCLEALLDARTRLTTPEPQPESPAAAQDEVRCVKCGHNNVSDAPRGASIYGRCMEPVKESAQYPPKIIACMCKCAVAPSAIPSEVVAKE